MFCNFLNLLCRIYVGDRDGGGKWGRDTTGSTRNTVNCYLPTSTATTKCHMHRDKKTQDQLQKNYLNNQCRNVHETTTR